VSLDDELRRAFLTAGLSDAQRAQLIEAGDERAFHDGEELFVESRPAELLWILLDGTIELTRTIGNDTHVVGMMTTPGQWAGGLTAWGPEGVYRATGRGVSPGRCLVVPSERLGVLVEEWSPFAKHIVLGVFRTISQIDAAARERTALLALGTMSAGLAHEINNPAAAALRTVDALRSTGSYMIASLTELAEQGFTAAQFLELDHLRVELQARAGQPAADALGRADLEERIGEWLEDHDVRLAWQFAPVLASTGIDTAWLEDLEERFPDGTLFAALRWITSTIGSVALLDELKEATSRIVHLVEDVKVYSAMDRAARARGALHPGIESTLVILGPKLTGIEVVRGFGDVPEFDIAAAELNQVWTNLIENAVDAMGGTGTLTIATRVEGGTVIVEITDTGHGVSPEVQARAFEPFFTTKDVGKGTGLGLDISRRIVVDGHGGRISLQPAPGGGTTARVELPLRR
jgi:signal transduction histidine kinase